MRLNLFRQTQKLLYPCTLFVVALFLLTLTSCCGKNAKVPTCVKLTKAQIQKWVNKGYSDPKNKDYMIALRIKTAFAFPGTVFTVFVIGVRKDYSLINESLTELVPVDTCKKDHIKLSDYIFTGTNTAGLSDDDLKIFKADGKIVDSLEFVHLDPYAYTDPASHYDFLAYNINVIGNGGVILKEVMGKEGSGLPCPPCPQCPKYACPAPPICETCGPAIDTTH